MQARNESLKKYNALPISYANNEFSPLLSFICFEKDCLKPISIAVINRIFCPDFTIEIRVDLHVKSELLMSILRIVNMINMVFDFVISW